MSLFSDIKELKNITFNNNNNNIIDQLSKNLLTIVDTEEVGVEQIDELKFMFILKGIVICVFQFDADEKEAWIDEIY